MTRKHFEMIARVLRETSPDLRSMAGVSEYHHALAEHFADVLSKTNNNFDRKRFIKACGIGEQS